MMRRKPKPETKSEPERKFVGVQMNPDLWRNLRMLAVSRDHTVIEELDDAIRGHLERVEKR